MTGVRFRKEAENDLRDIIGWYETVAPDSLGNILADIYRSIDQLTAFPRSGSLVPGRQFRRIVSLRYKFKIAYEIADEAIIVIGIFRYQDRTA